MMKANKKMQNLEEYNKKMIETISQFPYSSKTCEQQKWENSYIQVTSLINGNRENRFNASNPTSINFGVASTLTVNI